MAKKEKPETAQAEAKPPAKVDFQLVRRIDRNTIFGDKKAILKLVMSDENKTHFIARIGGFAIGTVTGKSKHGAGDTAQTSTWIKLVGRFQARNCRGEVFRSGAAFLPGDLAQTISDRLARDQSDNPTAPFLIDLYARYDESLATTYGYIIEPVRDPNAPDPLDEIFAKADRPQLTGPSTRAIEAPGETDGDDETF